MRYFNLGLAVCLSLGYGGGIAVLIALSVALSGCTTVCKTFPEWAETGYQNDVEHAADGSVLTGAAKIAGQIIEIVVDPACAIGSGWGMVTP